MKIVEVSSKKYKEPTSQQREHVKEQIKKLQKEDEKMIKGMFEFIDAQGGWLDFSFRFYPGEPIRTVHINHGEIVEFPRSLVKHLNNVWKKVRVPAQNLDTDKPYVERFSRTRFTPMDVL